VPLRGRSRINYESFSTLSGQVHTIENGKRIPLTPGMTVSAEIKTGTRAPIDYILAPLKKYGAESGRER
jgi:hypothetical protein